jgi:hypothetical protein
MDRIAVVWAAVKSMLTRTRGPANAYIAKRDAAVQYRHVKKLNVFEMPVLADRRLRLL